MSSTQYCNHVLRLSASAGAGVRGRPALMACAMLALLSCAPVVWANGGLPPEITQMELSGTANLPLGSDWGLVSSKVVLKESGQFRSSAEASAPGAPASFFDVFFDITITDIDSALDFGVTSPIVIPATSEYSPVHFELGDDGLYHGDLLIKHFFTSSFGGDPSINDVLKLGAADIGFTYEGGTNWGAVMNLSGGVFDSTADPPFGPFTLTGPTTASGEIWFSNVPEPATLALVGLGLGGLGFSRRKQ